MATITKVILIVLLAIVLISLPLQVHSKHNNTNMEILQTIATDMRINWPVLVDQQGWPPLGQNISLFAIPRGLIVTRGAFSGFYLPNVPLNGVLPISICNAKTTTTLLKFVNNSLFDVIPPCFYEFGDLHTFWFENNPDLIVILPDLSVNENENTTIVKPMFAAPLVNFVLDNVVLMNTTFALTANDTSLNTLMILQLSHLNQLLYLESYNFSAFAYLEILTINHNPNFNEVGFDLAFPPTPSTMFQCSYENNLPLENNLLYCLLAEVSIPRQCLTQNISCVPIASNRTCYYYDFYNEPSNSTQLTEFCPLAQNDSLTNLVLGCTEITVLDVANEWANVSICNLTEPVINAMECFDFCDLSVPENGLCTGQICKTPEENVTAGDYAIVPIHCVEYLPFTTKFKQPMSLVECNFTFGLAWDHHAIEFPPDTTPATNLSTIPMCFEMDFFSSLSGNTQRVTFCPPPYNSTLGGINPFGNFSALNPITSAGVFSTTFGSISVGIASCTGMKLMQTTSAPPPSKKKCAKMSCTQLCGLIGSIIAAIVMTIGLVALDVVTLGAATPVTGVSDGAVAAAIAAEETATTIADAASTSVDVVQTLMDVVDTGSTLSDVSDSTLSQSWITDAEETELDQLLQEAANNAKLNSADNFNYVADPIGTKADRLFDFISKGLQTDANQFAEELNAQSVSRVLNQPGVYEFTFEDGSTRLFDMADVGIDGLTGPAELPADFFEPVSAETTLTWADENTLSVPSLNNFLAAVSTGGLFEGVTGPTSSIFLPGK
jgi:hypothetical protein